MDELTDHQYIAVHLFGWEYQHGRTCPWQLPNGNGGYSQPSSFTIEDICNAMAVRGWMSQLTRDNRSVQWQAIFIKKQAFQWTEETPFAAIESAARRALESEETKSNTP